MPGQAHFLRINEIDSPVNTLIDSVTDIKGMDLELMNLQANTLEHRFSNQKPRLICC